MKVTVGERRSSASRGPGPLPRLFGAVVPLLLAGCWIGGAPSQSTPEERPGTRELTLTAAGEQRSYLLHVPPARPRRLGRAVAYPLLVVLHGSGADGQTVRRMSGLDSAADDRRFLVAYPNGTTGRLGLQSDWNAGECCGPARDRQVDDVAFVRSLIEQVALRMPVDRDRVFVAGFSDGARMAYRIGCELSDRVAAVAVVSGSLTYAHCRIRRPVPLVAFHGTADDQVAYDDSAHAAPARPVVAAASMLPSSVRFWAASNDCRSVSLARQSPHVTRATFGGCAADVMLFTIEDGQHAWPGGRPDGDAGDMPTAELSASREMVRFFFRHPRRP